MKSVTIYKNQQDIHFTFVRFIYYFKSVKNKHLTSQIIVSFLIMIYSVYYQHQQIMCFIFQI